MFQPILFFSTDGDYTGDRSFLPHTQVAFLVLHQVALLVINHPLQFRPPTS
ncbi:hypothetical protein FDUTEX481_01909 [Tolypothrix sp. PCC 7601]|nr:hypothetical protein FDUTEX481_01909 [Tolypothrix sp. PCC 7601]